MLFTTLVVSFCEDGGVNVKVNLWFLVVCVRCEVLCHFVVAGNKLQRTSHRTHTTKNHKFTLMLTPPSLQNDTTNVVKTSQSRAPDDENSNARNMLNL